MFPYERRGVPPFAPVPGGKSKEYIRLAQEWLPRIRKTASYLQYYTPLFEKYLPLVKQAPMLIQMAKLMNEPEEEESIQKEKHAETPAQKLPPPRPRQGKSEPKLFI